MPNLKVLRVWGLPTNEKEELIKMLPHLKYSFDRKKGCTMPTNDLCVCNCLCRSCVNKQSGFWEIEAKSRY